MAPPKGKSTGVTFKGAARLQDSAVKDKRPEEMLGHRGSNISVASLETIKAVEESTKIAKVPPEEEVAAEDTGKEVVAGPEAVRTEDATAATDAAKKLPGTRTQEQGAGVGESVGESVAD